ncbi:MAG: hypothetical protein IPN08_17335 [Bacteroidales bacterium]|nr:hypothetical protein [Bacteroidales bacterium]
MINRIPFNIAIRTMLVLLSLVALFHLLVLSGVIPYTITWGGKLRSLTQMRLMEFISLLVNALLMVVISMKAGYMNPFLRPRTITLILWFFVVLFALNTVGNLFAESMFEKLVFTPLTLVSAILCRRIVLER